MSFCATSLVDHYNTYHRMTVDTSDTLTINHNIEPQILNKDEHIYFITNDAFLEYTSSRISKSKDWKL